MNERRLRLMSLVGLLSLVAAPSCTGCSDDPSVSATDASSTTGSSGGSNAGGSGPSGPGVGGMGGGFEPPPLCENLECQQVVCEDAEVTTTVSGTIYDPSGTLPLYNVIVYVPNAEVEPLVDELTCDQCDSQLSGSPLVTAITDTEGKFVLENVPAGDDIPLVIQVGKWRRQITLPSVAACEDNPLDDPQIARLPRSRLEGDLPRIALATGNADPLFCLLRRLGLANEEYGVMGSDARVHFYHGARGGAPGSTRFDDGFGASPGEDFEPAKDTLWTDGWSDYDIVMLSCEGQARPGDHDGHRLALKDYVDNGGRVFATHFHYTWLQPGGEPAEVVEELEDLLSVATFGGNQDGDLYDGGTLYLDTDFPKGMGLADWLEFVDGSSPHGQFESIQGRAHTRTLGDTTRRWVYHDHSSGEIPIYFSFNTPVLAPVEEQCGKMVFSDIHVSSGAGSASQPFPSACDETAPLTEQEKVLLFMLFDLSACIQPDDEPVVPPDPN